MTGSDVDACVPVTAGVGGFSLLLCHDACRG
jgi:hypothetical protein